MSKPTCVTSPDRLASSAARHTTPDVELASAVQDAVNGGCTIHEIAEDLFADADKNGTGCVTLSEVYTSLAEDSPVLVFTLEHRRDLVNRLIKDSCIPGFVCEEEFVEVFVKFCKGIRVESASSSVSYLTPEVLHDANFGDTKRIPTTTTSPGTFNANNQRDSKMSNVLASNKRAPSRALRHKTTHLPAIRTAAHGGSSSADDETVQANTGGLPWHSNPKASFRRLETSQRNNKPYSQSERGFRVSDSATESTRRSSFDSISEKRPPQDHQQPAFNRSRAHRFNNSDGHSENTSRQATRHSLDDNLLRQNRNSRRTSRHGGGPRILKPDSNNARETAFSLRRQAFPGRDGGSSHNETAAAGECDLGQDLIKRPPIWPSSFDCAEAVVKPSDDGCNQSAGTDLWGNLKQSMMRSQVMTSRQDKAVSAMQQCIHAICDARHKAPEKTSPMYVNTSSRGFNPKLIRKTSMENYMAVFRGINIELDGTVKPDEFALHLERHAPGLAKHAVGMFDAMRRTAIKTGKSNGEGLDFGDILHYLFPKASDEQVQSMVRMAMAKKKPAVSKKQMMLLLDKAQEIFDEIHTSKSGWLSRREAEKGLGDVGNLFGTRGTCSERKQVQFKDFFAWYSNLEEIKQHVADTAYDISNFAI